MKKINKDLSYIDLIKLLLEKFENYEQLIKDLDNVTSEKLLQSIDYDYIINYKKPENVDIKKLIYYIIDICYNFDENFTRIDFDDNFIIDYIIKSTLPIFKDKQILLDEFSIQELLERGFKHCDFLKQPNLLKQSDLLKIFGKDKYNKQDLIKCGILQQIPKDSQNLDGLISIGFNIKELKELGYTIDLLSYKGFKRDELVSDNLFTKADYDKIYSSKPNIFENNYEIRIKLLTSLEKNKNATPKQLEELEALKKK